MYERVGLGVWWVCGGCVVCGGWWVAGGWWVCGGWVVCVWCVCGGCVVDRDVVIVQCLSVIVCWPMLPDPWGGRRRSRDGQQGRVTGR